MQKKIVRRDIEGNLSELANFHPLLQKIYASRDIHTVDDLNRELSDFLPYDQLLHIDRAVLRLIAAIQKDEKILFIGDFDADGATSTTLGVHCLRALGAKHVDFLLPSRFDYGYGLTPEIVDVAKDRSPNLIITVDNGISSIAGVAHANSLGIDVLVTDHHLPGDALPEACVIVNPNQPGDPFPSKCMAGVGVIFYVMLALRAGLKAINWFAENSIDCPNMADYLDLVALGTVADVVPLDKNNRAFVYQGLRRIKAGHARPGILALLEIARRKRSSIVASDLGYAIGPRLNAAGRLDDMSLGVHCLLAEDKETADDIARQLEALNHERRVIETQMKNEAFSLVDQLDFEHYSAKGICLYDPSWHQGIVGLVAARVKEKVHRPTIAFAKVEDGSLKGSVRSVKGLHIRDTLDRIATANPGLMTKFGGHAMAAGLSIPENNFEVFKEAFSKEVSRSLGEDDLRARVESDGTLDISEYTMEVAELLREAGPWGQGFPEPMFDGVFGIIDQRLVGEKHLKLTLQVKGHQFFLDAIAFNVDLNAWPNYHCKETRMAYRLDINDYRGRRRLQLIVEHLEPQPVRIADHV